MINFGGRGHSLIIHATDEKVIMAFGLEKPVFRIGVNTMGTLGTIGLTTNVMPSLTLERVALVDRSRVTMSVFITCSISSAWL